MIDSSTQTAHFGSRVVDVLVTLACWTYFIFGFLFFFSFFYVAAYLLASKREQAFQHLNYLFFKGFLGLLRMLAPRQKWDIDPNIKKIQSSIIVCNHLSYLDPLILISLLPKQKTIVKTKFFQAPVFGWLIKTSGYLPSTTEGKYGQRMIDQMEKMGEYLTSGGNLFVFPEGTRSRDSSLGELHKGVFKIARMCRCPVHVLSLSNSDRLFTPGDFFFHTRTENRISMKILQRFAPAKDGGKAVSVSGLEQQVRQCFQAGKKGNINRSSGVT